MYIVEFVAWALRLYSYNNLEPEPTVETPTRNLMKIVTDSGADLSFEECKQIGVTMVPLKVEVDGISYQAGVDIDPVKFYDMMDASPSMPITSTPSIGDFVEAYERLAQEDEDILSIHICK